MSVVNGQPEIVPILDIRETELTHQQCRELLALARQAIKRHLSSGGMSDLMPSDPTLNKNAGAFVTLWHSTAIDGSAISRTPSERLLRGCIGRTQADRPLYIVIQEMAIKAATFDFRFPPVTTDELDSIQIEISVLSPLERLDDINRVIIGHHGLMITSKNHRGLLLPEVAKRYGWSQMEFARYLCRKANLPLDHWRSKDANLFAFTTFSFDDAEFQ